MAAAAMEAEYSQAAHVSRQAKEINVLLDDITTLATMILETYNALAVTHSEDEYFEACWDFTEEVELRMDLIKKYAKEKE